MENSDPKHSSETQQELDRLDRLATLLDAAFRVPGTRWRFGLDGLIGLIPGVGDAFGGITSLYLISRAWRLKIPFTTFIRMLINAALEFVIGSIPLIGDLFDFWYKANLRNIKLLQQALKDKNRV
ncbi:hypothetical protein BGP75_02310 [Motiliproteus sp. MSK22-1]|nr:hypothetical protein BGP75_02310 [Motiliproteus sp. MSK22-1]